MAPDMAFILERGGAGRLPWVTSLDAKIGLNYRLGKDSVITAAVEGFNLFNSQRPVTVDENYTADYVSPILGAKQGSVPTRVWRDLRRRDGGQLRLRQRLTPPSSGRSHSPTGGAIRVGLPDPNGVLSSQPTNLTWGTPTNYQPVRQFRFSLRVTF